MRVMREIQEMKNNHSESNILRLNEDKFRISKINTLDRGLEEIKLDNRDYYNLDSGLYKIITDIKIPSGKAAILNANSDLLLNGCFLMSSVTNGKLNIMMNVTYGKTMLKKSTMIGEIFFVNLDSTLPIHL